MLAKCKRFEGVKITKDKVKRFTKKIYYLSHNTVFSNSLKQKINKNKNKNK